MNPGPIPQSGRSPGEGNGYWGAWWAMVYGLQRVRDDWTTNTHTGQYVMNESLFPYIKYILPGVYVLYSISSERFIVVLIKC